MNIHNFIDSLLARFKPATNETKTPLYVSAKGVRELAGDSANLGGTAFFRNRPLFKTLIDLLAAEETKPLRVLVHACSIGTEVYSFAIACELDPRLKGRVSLYATDIEGRFIDFAKRGVYPVELTRNFTPMEATFLEKVSEDSVRVSERIQARVNFLPACSYTDFLPEEPSTFDLVFILNSLCYVSAEQQSATIEKVSSYNTRYLSTFVFHLDTIKSDLVKAGYEPVTTNIHAIHETWASRQQAKHKGAKKPAPFYIDLTLPPFDKIPDYEFKYCSIFRKK